MEEVATASPATLPPIPQHILIKHEGHVIQVSSSNDDDDDDEFFHNRKNNDTGNNGKPPLPVNLPLVDEIDLQQCLISPPTPTWHASAIQGVVIGKEQLEVMCNHSSHHGQGAQSTIDGGDGVGTGFQACPCCRRFIQRGTTSHTVATDADVVMKDDNDTSGPMIRPRPALLEGKNTSNEHSQQRSEEDQQEHQPKSTSTLTNLWNNLTQANSSGINIAAPPLATGDQLQDYTITETIVQGWLYKKGTGDDWAGQRWWKPRWVTLALAERPNSTVPTPCLLSHRAPGVPYPASIMELTESTVIMAIDRTTTQNTCASPAHGNGEVSTSSKSIGNTNSAGSNKSSENKSPQKEEWNRHCFQIVHTQHSQNYQGQSPSAAATETSKKSTRIFTAPLTEERNQWVFAMNNALLSYEKRLAKARTAAAKKAEQEAQLQQLRSEQRRQKARRLGFDGLMLCGELAESEQHARHEESRVQQQQQQQQHRGRLHQTTFYGGSGGGTRNMRSPSPVQRGRGMGLPPTSPRARTSMARSPSPLRMVSSSEVVQDVMMETFVTP